MPSATKTKAKIRKKKKPSIARHPCPLCGKLFQAPSKVRRHVAEFHEGKKRVGRSSGKKRKKATSSTPTSSAKAKRVRTKKDITGGRKSLSVVAPPTPSSSFSGGAATSPFPSPSSASLSGAAESASPSNRFLPKPERDSKVHPCPYGCGKTFARPSKAQRHADEVHDKKTRAGRNERIPCPFKGCNKTYSRRDAVKVHVETVHLKRKPFGCLECGKAFGEKGNLKRHLRDIHGIRHGTVYGSTQREAYAAEPEPEQSPRTMEELACNALISLSHATTQMAVSALIGLTQ